MMKKLDKISIRLNKYERDQLKKFSDNNPYVVRFLDMKVAAAFNKEEKKGKKKKEIVAKKYASRKEAAEGFREDLIKKQTHAEKTLKIYLKELKIEYEFQKIYYTDTTFYIVDFFLPKYDSILEADGAYHKKDEQKKNDAVRTSKLKKLGISKVFRLWNSEIKNEELCKRKILSLLKK